MDYNWKEIFKEKSNNELFKIFLGDSYLPEETKKFAKKELLNRNFDFNNMSSV